MVFLNYSTMQMVAKIVYYGPGLCGKTTNLKEIYKKTSPRSRGEMVSLETETDRTLFFDLLPMDVGVVGGFKTKFQLYTVPGQVFYNSTRKLVLRGVDGIVFVADSQKPMEEANRTSYENLLENLTELGLEVGDVPLVFQYNKRDLPNILSVDELNESLNQLSRPFVEAAALEGRGVFETLKEISKQTLVKLRVKALDQERQSVQKIVPEPQELVEEDVETEDLSAQTVAMEISIDLPDEPDAMPDVVSFDDSDPESLMDEDSGGLPDFSGGGEEVLAAGADGLAIDSIEDDLDDFDLDFSEEDELGEDDLVDEDSLSFDEFTEFEEETGGALPTVHLEEDFGEDSMEDTLQNFEERELDDAVDLAVDSAFSIDIGSRDSASAFDAPPETNSEAPTVSMEVPLILDESEAPDMATDFSPDIPEMQAPVFQKDTDDVQADARPRPAKGKLDNSLKELESFATQAIKSKAYKTRKANVNVDSLLTDLVSEKKPGGGRVKPEKFAIKAPGNISAAQFNCIFLDDDENVVHTQLLKVTPRGAGKGRYKIVVSLDIEVEE